jgi:lipopolysaccharide/colanic/teichoic acid biosynthesis glycosyltransferase
MTRFFDIIISIISITIFLPFLMPIMIGLALTGEHHIFYLQPRVGKNNIIFMVIKFATMLKNSPNMAGGFITQKNDQRVLPLGHFLRKTKINELPQLINILMGQMSFVGPRPIVAEHLALYPEATQKAILQQTPGLTGLGSLIFRDEEGVLDRAGGDRKHTHDTIIAPYKGELELWYYKNKNLSTYFIIIFLTAWSIINPRSDIHRRLMRDLPPVPPELQPYL